MWDDTLSLLTAVGSDLDDTLKLGYLSCDIEQQDAAVKRLDLLASEVDAHRLKAISVGRGEFANGAWVAHNAVKGGAAFLAMWTHLKRDQFASAWECLVDAEELISSALRFRDSPLLRDVIDRLLSAERLLFAPSLYVSSSILFKSFSCSICDSEYGSCTHISGRLYMGELCVKVVKDIVGIDHVAIVHDPEDKHLRFPPLTDRNKCPCLSCSGTKS